VLVATVILRLFDPTVVTGVPAWNKPTKFSLSFLAFGPTMLWIYGQVRLSRFGRVALELTGWSMVLGAVWAAGAAYLGLSLTLCHQAQRGLSVLAPDGFTLVMALGLIGLPAAAAIALTLLPAPRRPDPDPVATEQA
jgi:hypothetical protein